MEGSPESEFYRPIVDERLHQGDIFGCVPLLHLRTTPPAVRPTSLSGGRHGFEVRKDFDAASATSSARQNVQVVADCDFTQAVLLTYDCEIDKPTNKQLALAIIRPFNFSEADAEGVRGSRRLSFFYLPAEGDAPECYVDFRRLVTLSPAVVGACPRLRRLGEASRDAMMMQFIRFFTRRQVTSENSQVMPEGE